MLVVYRYRVKSLLGWLNRQARAVNFVWNYCNDVQRQAIKWNKRWPSGFDLNKLTAGSSQELGLHSGTVNAVCEQYAKSRSQKRRPWLRWRSKKSPGWVPLKGYTLKREGSAFRFLGQTFRVFLSRPLPEGKIRDGSSFAQDRRGNWFLNIAIEVAEAPARVPERAVGIDLGLKDLATLSTGEKIGNPRHFEALEARLGAAQRANKHRQARNLHARIAHARRDFLHKLSTRLVREFDYLAVGNVNAAALGQTSLAKSVHDVGWSSFRSMLRYKAMRHGAWFEEVNEAFSTVTCSACNSRTGPTGREGLRIREWQCRDCGAYHDRDSNAALNILRAGRGSPGVGIRRQ